MIRALILGAVAYCAASALLPYPMTHRLDAACHWQRSGALGAVLDASPGEPEARARVECLYARGLRSDSPFLQVILTEWPSPAMMRALEAHRASRPLPPEGQTLDVQPGDQR